MRNYFTNKDSWSGGYYELAIELGEHSDEHSDERLTAAMKALWSYPLLKGVYLQRDKETFEQQRILTHDITVKLAEQSNLQGLATLPNNMQVACGTVDIREEEGSDWLVFYIPLGALSEVYPVGGYPFQPAGDETFCKLWQVPIDLWLVDVGKYVFNVVDFRLGLVGFDVSGRSYAHELLETGIPEQRYEGYLWPKIDELRWYPPNLWPLSGL
jgi:hypothetical protein